MALKFNTKGMQAFGRAISGAVTNQATYFTTGSMLPSNLNIKFYSSTMQSAATTPNNQAYSTTAAAGYLCGGTASALSSPTAANGMVFSATFNVTSFVAGTAFTPFTWAVINVSTAYFSTDSIGTSAGSVIVVPNMFHDGNQFTCTLALKMI